MVTWLVAAVVLYDFITFECRVCMVYRLFPLIFVSSLRCAGVWTGPLQPQEGGGWRREPRGVAHPGVCM